MALLPEYPLQTGQTVTVKVDGILGLRNDYGESARVKVIGTDGEEYAMWLRGPVSYTNMLNLGIVEPLADGVDPFDKTGWKIRDAGPWQVVGGAGKKPAPVFTPKSGLSDDAMNSIGNELEKAVAVTAGTMPPVMRTRPVAPPAEFWKTAQDRFAAAFKIASAVVPDRFRNADTVQAVATSIYIDAARTGAPPPPGAERAPIAEGHPANPTSYPERKVHEDVAAKAALNETPPALVDDDDDDDLPF